LKYVESQDEVKAGGAGKLAGGAKK